MTEYEKVLKSANLLQNKLALNTLLEVGRKKLLDENYCKEILNDINKSEKDIQIVRETAKYQKDILEIAISMAKLNDEELCEFIYNKKKLEKKREMEK